MELVFVYGTLKDGFPNSRFNAGERIVGEFFTNERYELYLVGERFVPWLIDQPGVGSQVTGELFAVDTAGLEALDALESVGKPHGYARSKIAVTSSEAADVRSAFVYMKSSDQLSANEVRAGPLVSYELSHAALYVPRSKRLSIGKGIS